MARIRTIKPTAFTSRSLAAVSIPARWMFAGLWTYADDEGRGDAEPRLIKAAVFPLDDEVTPADVSAMLLELGNEGVIRLYDVSGRSYFQVVHWWHQKVSHPSPSGIPPEPSGNSPENSRNPVGNAQESTNTGPVETSEIIPEPLRSPPETFAPDRDLYRDRDREGESALRAPAREATTPQTIVGEWIDHCAKRPPKNVIGQVGRTVNALFMEGIDPDDVRRGLAAWASKGLHPSTLPSVVNEVMNAPKRNGRSTTDDRVNQALDLAAHFDNLERKAITK